MREPLIPSLQLLEISHVSNYKSSITLRCFNMSLQSITDCTCKDTKDFDNNSFFKENLQKMFVESKIQVSDSFMIRFDI